MQEATEAGALAATWRKKAIEAAQKVIPHIFFSFCLCARQSTGVRGHRSHVVWRLDSTSSCCLAVSKAVFRPHAMLCCYTLSYNLCVHTHLHARAVANDFQRHAANFLGRTNGPYLDHRSGNALRPTVYIHRPHSSPAHPQLPLTWLSALDAPVVSVEMPL